MHSVCIYILEVALLSFTVHRHFRIAHAQSKFEHMHCNSCIWYDSKKYIFRNVLFEILENVRISHRKRKFSKVYLRMLVYIDTSMWTMLTEHCILFCKICNCWMRFCSLTMCMCVCMRHTFYRLRQIFTISMYSILHLFGFLYFCIKNQFTFSP